MVSGDFAVQATIPAGQPLALGLPGAPSTGYTWQVVGVAPRLTVTSAYLNPSPDPTLLGGTGLQVFILTADTPGAYEVRWSCRRAWLGAADAVATAHLTLSVS